MILLQCQVLMGKLAKFELDLDIHIYTHNQVKQEESVGDKTGAFSVVTKVILPDKTEAALKMMHKPITSANADDFMKEFCNCSQLQDTNLVKLYGSIMLSPSPCLKLGLLFEWCGGGSLADFISRSQQQADDKRCNHERAGKTMKQILAGVKYLHARSMIHRDLKPENVMLTVNEDVRIADFATAKRQAEITGFQIVGTDIYMAPEVYDCLPYSLSSDMYSVGVMMWEIWN
ncbi:uncharacterized protein LOC134185619 [Corticium candelabrum]|uniref:uncharacterized protein LOC134185619 n=1 Tax=Corticium candelabrum TaxID=121492 RepID=UPI002E25ACF2|nr:uncharacterized protein LOC134185619 [Corticium candelabrum]